MRDHHLYGRDDDGNVTYAKTENRRFVWCRHFEYLGCGGWHDKYPMTPVRRSWKRYRRTQFKRMR